MSLRMDRVQDPIIPQVAGWIRETPGTISLGQGVVHYPPPPQSRDRVDAFWENPKNNLYAPVSGIEPLREAIKRKLKKDNDILVSDLQEVVVTAGANMGFLNALLAVTEIGDEVILFAPYYFNHEMAITMLGCKPVCIPLSDSFEIDLDVLARHITPKTKAIVTVSPNNPTGSVFSRATLEAINSMCGEKNMYHISDEAYEYFTFDRVDHFSPASLPNAEGHTISLFSLSKSFGFAGWRIGYMLIPKALALPVEKAQDTNLICPTIASQYAALGALEAGSAYPRSFISGLQEVRELVYDRLGLLGEFCSVVYPKGAFYFMIRLDTSQQSLKVVEYLIGAHRVAVLPGAAFGMNKKCYLRIAYGALQKETVAEGVDRLVSGLQSLKANN